MNPSQPMPTPVHPHHRVLNAFGWVLLFTALLLAGEVFASFEQLGRPLAVAVVSGVAIAAVVLFYLGGYRCPRTAAQTPARGG